MAFSDEGSELTDYGSLPTGGKKSKVRKGHLTFLVCVVATCSVALFVFVVAVSFESVHNPPWAAAQGVLPLSMVMNMDAFANPCDDFWQFSCGSFEKRAKIPSDKQEWALAWDTVEQRNQKLMHTLIKNDTGRVGKFYRSCMNEQDINVEGGVPLAPFLGQISKIKTRSDLLQACVSLQQVNVPVLFDWEVIPDPAEPRRWAVHIIQGGLTMPSRDFYLKNDESTVKQRDSYKRVVRRVLELSGLAYKEAEDGAETVLKVPWSE